MELKLLTLGNEDEEQLPSRISGSESWKKRRGEDGNSKESCSTSTDKLIKVPQAHTGQILCNFKNVFKKKLLTQ